jgi:hypothetical protein
MTFKASSHAPQKLRNDMELLHDRENFYRVVFPLEKDLAQVFH